MRPELIPDAFREQYAKCPTCALRKPMSTALLDIHHRLRLYGQCLRQAKDKLPGLFQREFELTHRALDEAIDLFRDTVDAERAAYAEAISQYFTSDQFGLGDTRLRRGVSANHQQWIEADVASKKSDTSFDQLETAHLALAEAYKTAASEEQRWDSQLDYFMLYGFDPIRSAHRAAQQFAAAFRAALAPWIDERETAAFNILGDLKIPDEVPVTAQPRRPTPKAKSGKRTPKSAAGKVKVASNGQPGKS